MNQQEWVTVYTDSNAIRAEIVKNALEAEGVTCVLEGALQAAEPGLAALPIKIQVASHDVTRACDIIESGKPTKTVGS